MAVRGRRPRRVWIPVAVAFATGTTVSGFGFDAVMSSPGAVMLALLVTVVALVPGAIVGAVVVGSTRILDRAPRTQLAVGALLRGVAAAVAGGAAAGLFAHAMIASRGDGAQTSAEWVVVVSVVAAVVAALDYVRRERDSASTR